MGGPRRRSRAVALQILHQMDVSPELGPDAGLGLYFAQLAPPGGEVAVDEEEPGASDAGAGGARPFESNTIDRGLVEQLVHGVSRNRADLDQMLASASKNWRLERMALVDRNVIRLALYEIKHCPDVPVAVAINEAIELCKHFGSAEAPAFVNGLLDRAVDELGLRR
jgi:transcription antitermination protein NusB